MGVFSRPRPGQTEVTDSDAAVAVYEKVAWLKISMQKVASMDIVEGTEGVIHHRYNMVLLQNCASMDGVQDLFEVRLDVLEHQENCLELAQIQI